MKLIVNFRIIICIQGWFVKRYLEKNRPIIAKLHK